MIFRRLRGADEGVLPGRGEAAPRWRRLAIRAVAVIVMLTLLATVGFAMFPWGLFKDRVERQLAAATGQPVTIGRMEREDLISFHPTVMLADLHIPQAAWAGSGDLARIRTLRVRFAAIALLGGRFDPEEVAIDGARLTLVRDADGRKNWDVGGKPDPDAAAARPRIDQLTISDSILIYRDAKQRRAANLRVATDIQRGLWAEGRGTIHGAPVVIAARGGLIAGAGSSGPWPFAVEIRGDAVGMTLVGRMDRALDFGHFTAQATAHGDDLALLDAIIEAGLPATQPVRLRADVRHRAPDWEITNLTGTIGRSDIAGDAKIVKRGGRTRIDGVIRANRFDFDDLASDEGRRIAAEKRARVGDRIVPDTAIDLATVDRTDGRLEISARQLIWPGSSPFRALSGVLDLYHSRLTIRPLTLALERGRMVGTVGIDQRGRPAPLLSLDLDLQDARLIDFFPDAAIDGGLVGHIRLTGTGQTIRAAVGRSTGSIALVARDGRIPSRTASLLGEDIGRGLTAEADDRSVLHCIVARLDVAQGVATANPVVIDTSRAGTRAEGTIRLADERLDLMLKGAPKTASLLRLTEPIAIGGTIEAPDIRVPEKAKSVGGVLKMLGKAIGGRQGELAGDADCDALAAAALR